MEASVDVTRLRRTRATEIGDFWRDGSPLSVHQRLANSWWAWLLWAFILEDSARCIAQSFSYTERSKGSVVMPSAFGVRAMLIGYAIECALKGLWIKKGNTIVRRGRYVRVPGARDHDLVQLARQVGFSASNLEADVLGGMSKFATFAGRYPIAKTPDAMQPNQLDGFGPVDVCFFSKRDFRTANSILNKVITLISGKKRRAIPRYSALSNNRRTVISGGALASPFTGVQARLSELTRSSALAPSPAPLGA